MVCPPLAHRGVIEDLARRAIAIAALAFAWPSRWSPAMEGTLHSLIEGSHGQFHCPVARFEHGHAPGYDLLRECCLLDPSMVTAQYRQTHTRLRRQTPRLIRLKSRET